ncbi:MAG: formylglycine-generating enzyme family protein, partial [Microcystis panniformis]
LYDMHGNIWEWCLDTWHDNYVGAPSDGSAWQQGKNDNDYHLLRGGSWYNYPGGCRSAFRFSSDNLSSFYGFRVVCVPPRTS